jgi:hypothetical protein
MSAVNQGAGSAAEAGPVDPLSCPRKAPSKSSHLESTFETNLVSLVGDAAAGRDGADLASRNELCSLDELPSETLVLARGVMCSTTG